MKLVRTCAEGDVLPRFYGVAWRDWCSNRAVCLPVPINVVAAVLRALWAFLKAGHLDLTASPRDAYLQGLRKGWSRSV